MFQNRIAEQRKKAGLSQEKLAEALESGRSQVVKLERGERQLTLDWMRRIAKALGCLPVDILPIDDVYIDHKELDLMQHYRSLSDGDKDRLLAVVTAFVSGRQ